MSTWKWTCAFLVSLAVVGHVAGQSATASILVAGQPPSPSALFASGTTKNSFTTPDVLYADVALLSGKNVKKVAVSTTHFAILTSDRVVLYDGAVYATPATPIDVAVGSSYKAILAEDGKVYVDGSATSGSVVMTSLCGGDAFVCSISRVGELYCSGASATAAMTKVSGTDTVLQAACGATHVVYLAKSELENSGWDGNLVKCFDKSGSVCGSSSATQLSTVGHTPMHVAAGAASSWYVDKTGVLYGKGTPYLSGDGSSVTAQQSGAGETFEKHVIGRVFAGGSNVFVITATGQTFVWGNNNGANGGHSLGTGTAAIATATWLELYDPGSTIVRSAFIATCDAYSILLTESTCTWFSQYKQMDFNYNQGSFNRTQGRRDLSACGMCAGYGSSCEFVLNPVEVQSADFGMSSMGGYCEPVKSTSGLTVTNMKLVGRHHRACLLDEWLLGRRRRDDNLVTVSETLFRSDTWFPGPNDNINAFQEVVWPNLYARYHITPPHKYVVIRVVVMTNDVRQLGDNIDLVAKFLAATSCDTLTLDNAAYQSIRESNPWAIDVPQTDVATSTNAANGLCFAVYGDNQYPQKAGPSEYKLKVWFEPEFPDFSCGSSSQAYDTCFTLGSIADATYSSGTKPSSMKQNILKIGKADRFEYTSGKFGIRLNRKSASQDVGINSPSITTPELANGFVWTEKIYLQQGFETNFKFIVKNRYLCNGEDGFCGGGDGFAFFVHGKDGAVDTALYGASGNGQDMGVKGVGNLLVIEFDTWHNPAYYDPKQGVEHWWINATEYVSYADNHIAIFAAAANTSDMSCPLNTMAVDHSSDHLIAATPSIPNLSDGNEHTVKIWYLPSFGTHPGTVTIFIDNMERPALVGEITLMPTTTSPVTDPNGSLKKWEVLDKHGAAYVGFLGSQADAPQDLILTSWDFNRFPGRVGY